MIKHPDVCEGCLPAEAVVLNRNEIAARLHASRTFEDPLIDRCLARLLSVVSYKYCYVRLPVSFPEANLCNFGFAEAASADLAKNLKGCREVFLFAVTAGIGVDRLLSRLSAAGTAENFITDALSSAAVESLCDAVSEMLGRNCSCRPRFSPGYGDLSIDFQQPFLERIDAYARLGVTLNEARLMTPMKTITAIMGIKTAEEKGCPKK